MVDDVMAAIDSTGGFGGAANKEMSLKWTGFTWPRGYKIVFMLNSIEHEIFHANKFQITNNAKFFLAIVGIFIFISRENFMLSWGEHEKSYIASGPGSRVSGI